MCVGVKCTPVVSLSVDASHIDAEFLYRVNHLPDYGREDLPYKRLQEEPTEDAMALAKFMMDDCLKFLSDVEKRPVDAWTVYTSNRNWLGLWVPSLFFAHYHEFQRDPWKAPPELWPILKGFHCALRDPSFDDTLCRLCGHKHKIRRWTTCGNPKCKAFRMPRRQPQPEKVKSRTLFPCSGKAEAPSGKVPVRPPISNNLPAGHGDSHTAELQEKDGSWICSQCTLLNKKEAEVCEVCQMRMLDAVKPFHTGPGASTGQC